MTVTAPTARPGPRLGLRSAATTAGTAAALGVVANLVVYGIARAAGTDFAVVRPDGVGFTVGPASVLLMSVVPLLLGGVALAVVARWGQRGWHWLAWIGLAIGLLTVVMPISTEASSGTTLALALMHVLTGVAWFVIVRRFAGSPAVDR